MKLKDVKLKDLRFRVIILHRDTTDDGGGGYTEAWIPRDTVWASVTPVRAGERWFGMQLEQPITHMLVMRYREDISVDPDFGLEHDGRRLNIRSVIDIEERKRFLEISAEEGVAE